MENNKSACLYWARLENHKDIVSEGYVGFTSMPLHIRERMHRQYQKRKKSIFYFAIKEFKEKIIFEKILIADADYCLLIEEKLRPTPLIGWNTGIGGTQTTLGRKASPQETERRKISWRKRIRWYKHSEEIKLKIGEAARGRTHSEESKLKMSNSLKGRRMSEKRKAEISAFFKGKKLPPDQVRKSALSRTGKKYAIVTCPYCLKLGAGPNMKRWHFDKCPNKIGVF